MPFFKSRQYQYTNLFKSIGIVILSTYLASCGGSSNTPPTSQTNEDNSSSSTLQPNEVLIKLPLEMRNVNLKLYDNSSNQVVTEIASFSGTSSVLKFPIEKANRIYRLEITASQNSQIYDFINDKYVTLDGTYHALLWPTSTKSRIFFVSPVSEAVYQRALVRAGQLPDENIETSKINDTHFIMAMQDINTALLNAFKNENTPTITNANALTNLSYSTLPQNTYLDSYLSFGYFVYWYSTHNQTSSYYSEFTQNIALDLADGYLDGKSVIGNKTDFTPLVTTVENTDPLLNTAPGIGANQKTARDQFANGLKDAVLNLAVRQLQPSLNSIGYKALTERAYSGTPDTPYTSLLIRTAGAGDYRRAVGFTTSSICGDSIYPCKQGISGINNDNTDLNFPTIEYLIGRYEANKCVLKIRATGEIELSQGSQSYKSTLDGGSTDNLLQVNASTQEYILNSGSAEPSNSSQQYPFIQLKIKANKVLSASAGLDKHTSPAQLENEQLSCTFN
ncbi:hypothetical protein IAE19_03405 [Acinetobacter sp. S40]|uniref:hypothetical protein n=1 Tax=Acinetobacter sp. S40 TaxID=2767434 RepID=UPI00190AFAD1|nr:hypothetical protein [Acinetobacter sp. S40]MBJ9984484.1 hypothetical protein [Acinetobacter sp. S40]